MITTPTLKALVGLILAQPFKFQWSVQGLGMLRLYVGKVGRIHIWDDRLEAPNVSKIHNHSWPLRSTIIAGTLRNQRYYETYNVADPQPNLQAYFKQRAITGFKFEFQGPPVLTMLLPRGLETYGPGDVYEQSPAEPHYTDADRGTITIMERPSDGDTGQADVYWPVNETWGSAVPHPATPEQIEMVTRHAWDLHFTNGRH